MVLIGLGDEASSEESQLEEDKVQVRVGKLRKEWPQVRMRSQKK